MSRKSPRNDSPAFAKKVTKIVLSAALAAGGTAYVAPVFQALADNPSISSTPQDALNAANNATTAAEMQSAIEDPALGLNLGNYARFPANLQMQAAQKLLNMRYGGGFSDIPSLQTAFDAVLKDLADAALQEVNNSGTDADMRSALEEPALGLNFGGFYAS